MPELSPIRRAVVSVSNKAGLDALAKTLSQYDVEVLSTGGTKRALVGAGLPVQAVSEYTGAPEILGGRVKTLHPKIHGGILAMPTPEHVAELEQQGIGPIDLVVVNLYPFRETIAKPDCGFADAIENIDIGGPTMVRAAAKNWGRVTVIIDPDDYPVLAEVLAKHDGKVPADFRKQMAAKAFAHTAAYDAAIATYWANEVAEPPAGVHDVPRGLFVSGQPVSTLRYGENPHQAASFFRTDYAADEPVGLDRAIVHQGKALSYNNLLDADAALGLARDLSPHGVAAAVFKHLSPCGAAVAIGDESLASVYRRAREADAESAFGGIVSVTRPIDVETAKLIVETFIEVVVAPGYDPQALEILSRKKNLRALEVPDMFVGLDRPQPLRLRSVAGGVLVQREDEIKTTVAQGKVVTKRPASPEEIRSLELGQCVGKHVRSNAVVLVKDGATVGIGGGQTSRVEAVRQAIRRAQASPGGCKGSVLASDAFFPFRDSIDALAQAGVVAVVEPGGSKRDQEVIQAADEHDMAMVFTGERHFRH